RHEDGLDEGALLMPHRLTLGIGRPLERQLRPTDALLACHPPLATAHGVEAEIRRDAIEPGAHRVVLLTTADGWPVVEAQEGLLREVIRLVRANDPCKDRVHPPVVLLEHGLECGELPRHRALHDRHLLHVPRTPSFTAPPSCRLHSLNTMF